MSKKNNNRNNYKQPMGQTPKTPILKQVSALTSDEKEQLINEGKIIKADLIKQGDAEKKSMFEKALEETEKTLEDARIEAKAIIELSELEKLRILSEYKSEIKEIALLEVEEDKAEILNEVNLLKNDFELRLRTLSYEQEELSRKSEDLERETRDFLVESSRFDVAKRTYKIELLNGLKNEMDALEHLCKKLTDDNNISIKELQKAQKVIDALEVDKLYLENEIESNIIRSQDIFIHKNKNDMLSAENMTINKLFQESTKMLAQKDAMLYKYGNDPQKAFIENIKLQEENKILEDKVSICPSEAELIKLREINQAHEILISKHNHLKDHNKEVEKELLEANIYKDDLDNHRRFIKVLELQKTELQKELDRIIQTYNNRRSNVFASLSKIDKEDVHASHSKQNISLKDLCDNFRNYLASRDTNPLYYSREQIRTFIAGFASTRIMILEGMSGTGKSSLPSALEDYIDCVTEKIPVQSSWKDRNDLLGFYNDFEKRFKETEFLKALYRATRDSDNIHCIVLDEINLSRVEYYFADFLSVLEDDLERKWKINLISDDVGGEMPEYIVDGQLRVLKNTWFIGTANNDDSTHIITDKVYDRAISLNFKKREDAFKAERTTPIHLSNSEFQLLLSKATRTTKEELDSIEKIVNELDEFMQTYFEISFGNRISKQINQFVPAYIACGGNRLEAIDIIFSNKVLRKLSGLYDEGTKKNLNEFLAYLNGLHSNSADFWHTKETIRKMIERI